MFFLYFTSLCINIHIAFFLKKVHFALLLIFFLSWDSLAWPQGIAAKKDRHTAYPHDKKINFYHGIIFPFVAFLS